MSIHQPAFLIDAHVHLMTEPRAASAVRWAQRLVPGYQPPRDHSPAALLQELSLAGADACFNLFYPLRPGESDAIHAWQAGFARSNPRVIPFASVHVADEDPAATACAAMDGLGMAGIKLHPYVQGFNLLDRRLDRLYGLVQERQWPLLVHTGFAEFYRQPSMCDEFLEFLRRYPAMRSVPVHMLYPDLDLRAWPDLLERYPGLVLDVTNTVVLAAHHPADAQALVDLLATYSSRMLLGSDFPLAVDNSLPRIYQTALELCPHQQAAEDLCWRSAVALVGRHRFPFLLPPA
ncbi:MAG: amidohydrolase family protein [Syntrophomonadaceae bacterium]|nr:amidohydrolase [Syntrophomonadaceae bacterium]MDH7497200.1 amidohydrolase family protein [Syntrophomonadaceae bacterium]